MSDALVKFQDWIAQYPSWMVAGGIGFAVVVIAVLFWKAMKVAVTALVVAILVAGGWYVWEHVGKKDDPRTRDPVVAPASGASRTTTP